MTLLRKNISHSLNWDIIIKLKQMSNIKFFLFLFLLFANCQLVKCQTSQNKDNLSFLEAQIEKKIGEYIYDYELRVLGNDRLKMGKQPLEDRFGNKVYVLHVDSINIQNNTIIFGLLALPTSVSLTSSLKPMDFLFRILGREVYVTTKSCLITEKLNDLRLFQKISKKDMLDLNRICNKRYPSHLGGSTASAYLYKQYPNQSNSILRSFEARYYYYGLIEKENRGYFSFIPGYLKEASYNFGMID